MSLPITIESLLADDARAEEFTLTIALAHASAPKGQLEAVAPPRSAVVVVSWRTRHFRAPETLPEGWTPFALAEFGIEGLRCPVVAPPAGLADKSTLAIPGLRHAEIGKKRRIRVHLLVDGVPVESARMKRKARKQ